jgi:hypothetical protein
MAFMIGLRSAEATTWARSSKLPNDNAHADERVCYTQCGNNPIKKEAMSMSHGLADHPWGVQNQGAFGRRSKGARVVRVRLDSLILPGKAG